MDRSLTSSFYFQISSRIQMRSTFGELSVTRRSSARRSPADMCSVLTTHFRIRSETFQMILIFTKIQNAFYSFRIKHESLVGLMFQRSNITNYCSRYLYLIADICSATSCAATSSTGCRTARTSSGSCSPSTSSTSPPASRSTS